MRAQIMTKSILSWLEKNLGPSRSSHNGTELSVCCPFCDDTKYHLYYNTQKDVWNCFKCNSSGRGLDLIMMHEDIDAYTAAMYLSQGPKPIYKQPKVEPLKEMPSHYKALLPVPNPLPIEYAYIYKYALRRKFTLPQIEFYGLGLSTDHAYRCRLIIPVERGYFQARAIFQQTKPKYTNPEHPKEDRLFNHRFLGYKRIAICEGAFSAIAASRDTNCPAVAILGKKATYEQMLRIARSKPEMVEIAFDAGTESDDSTLELAEFLRSYGIAVYIRAYEFGDPDECSQYNIYRYTPTYGLRARLARIK